jgi:hypothetical protein
MTRYHCSLTTLIELINCGDYDCDCMQRALIQCRRLSPISAELVARELKAVLSPMQYNRFADSLGRGD